MSKNSFDHLARESLIRKENALKQGKNGMVPHDLWRRIIPIAQEFDRGLADMALLYSYLIANVNGETGNDRFMSAFPSVEVIATNTRLSRNRVAGLSNALEAVGLLRTAYDYAGNKRDKLYYPQYYSDLTDDELRERLALWERTDGGKGVVWGSITVE